MPAGLAKTARRGDANSDCGGVLLMKSGQIVWRFLFGVASLTATASGQLRAAEHLRQYSPLATQQLASALPMLVAGDPAGVPADSPAMRVDPNTTTSSFAGVGSLFIDAAPIGDGAGFLCSAAAIHGFSPGTMLARSYILTAAHCLDMLGGIDLGGNPTGDGVADVAPEDVSFVLNFGSNLSHIIPAAEIHIHPNWHGFNNVLAPEGASIQDDLAVIRLSSPLPADLPIYNIATALSPFAEAITAAGYGESGDPSGFSVAPSFAVKRVGVNQADAVLFDDELTGTFDTFVADFDGPDETTNVIDVGFAGFDPAIEGTRGNDKETVTGPGDSGSPSFLSDFFTGDLILGIDGQPIIYGLNTFATSSAPAFGSLHGGPLVPAYADWIDSVIVPEPAASAMVVAGLLGVPWVARRRQRRYAKSLG
jgi:hypothetical protein